MKRENEENEENKEKNIILSVEEIIDNLVTKEQHINE